MKQGSKEGAKHCKMCHVLMAIASCSQGVTEQKCHAGATVLIHPVEDEGIAVLTSCACRHDDHLKSVPFVEQRAGKLGLDKGELAGLFKKLPNIDDQTVDCIKELMPLTVSALKDLIHCKELENELRELKGRSDVTAGELLKKEFAEAAADSAVGKVLDEVDISVSKTPALIKVVCSVVSRKPQIPYTVDELAAAARMTPNYFSSIFHKYTGQCFMDYLTDKRIDRAKTLLKDPSLNIGEVASMCGYDDPGYFTRRFRKKTGMTPKAWRNTDSR
jgi:AraC-like DNA-binding protein